ncbi:MAG TPA: glycosyltransferase family A protein [Solirubrobacteraceae bacterium]|nr:glycosyltransferase family A protein [Solirubrobacteraceae bacterium]
MRVGVLVPVHGFAPYLPEALDTVLAEEPAEVVVIDDGSPEALALHPDHAGHCRLVRREQRGGPAAARQTGLQALGAEIEAVALCDADDAWTAGSLAPRLRAVQDGADVAFGRAEIVGVDGQPTGEVWPLPAGGPSLEELYRANPLCTASAIVRRATLEAAGGFATPLALAEDWDLWLRLAAGGARFASVPEAVVRYRRHPGGLTADVEALARAQHRLHARHAALVGGRARRRAQARDLAALADGLAARGAYCEARVALRGSMRLGRVSPRSAARAFALAVPGIRGRLGGRAPYP